MASGQVLQARIKGAFVNPDQTYQMVINKFMAVGGDGYPKMTAHASYVDTGFVDAEVLRAYIVAHSPLQAANYAPPKGLTCKERHCE